MNFEIFKIHLGLSFMVSSRVQFWSYWVCGCWLWWIFGW